jgi:hypothetical protein
VLAFALHYDSASIFDWSHQMNIFKNLGYASILTLVAAAGCAGDPVGPGGDNGGSDNGGSGDNGGGDGSGATQPLDATGKYKMLSTFDIATNVPGTAGTIVNDIIDATDSPDDPTNWVLTQLVNQLPNGTIKTLLEGAIPFVSGYLNDRVLDWAPDFVTTMVQVGNDFGDITKHFGLNETLDITGGGVDGNYSATRTSLGAHFVINTQTFDLGFSDYQIANVVVPGIGITMDATGKLAVAMHELPLPYGGIIHMGLDAAVIPMVDANAHNLGELLADKIDCQAVGQYINDALVEELGFGPGATAMATACTAGLNAGANAIYAKINAISATALEFDVDGTAKAADTNHDYKIDALQTGKWEGTLSYAGTPAPLAPAPFTGARM